MPIPSETMLAPLHVGEAFKHPDYPSTWVVVRSVQCSTLAIHQIRRLNGTVLYRVVESLSPKRHWRFGRIEKDTP